MLENEYVKTKFTQKNVETIQHFGTQFQHLK